MEHGQVISRNLTEISHFLDPEVYSLLLLAGQEVTNLTDFHCDCLVYEDSAYTGENCETIIPCSQNPCENNSTCINLNDTEDYVCVCSSLAGESFTGKNCEIEAPCNENMNPCVGNSTCTNSFDLSSSACSCRVTAEIAFTGEFCEIEAPCNEGINPCVNNATCVNSQDLQQYHCGCDNNINNLTISTGSILYTGQNCEIEAPCNEQSRCFNSAECFNSVNWAEIVTNQISDDDFNAYSCSCTANYTGANCEIEAPCNEFPCGAVDSGAVCENSLDLSDYTCSCSVPDEAGIVFTGQNCDIDAICNDFEICQNGGECFNSEDLESHAIRLKTCGKSCNS